MTIAEFIEELYPLVRDKKLSRTDGIVQIDGQDLYATMYQAGTIIRIDIKPISQNIQG